MRAYIVGYDDLWYCASRRHLHRKPTGSGSRPRWPGGVGSKRAFADAPGLYHESVTCQAYRARKGGMSLHADG